MDECAVINASPLIFLARSGHLALLPQFARRLVVPQPVAEELLRRGEQDVTAQALRTDRAYTVTPVAGIPPFIEQWGLGGGESAVLALAQATAGAVAVMDDLMARRCAAALGIPVRGTLGIVLAAKKNGFIPLARPVLEDMVRGGMFLSRQVLDEALRRVGE